MTGNRIAEARSYPMHVGASPQVLSLTRLNSPCAACLLNEVKKTTLGSLNRLLESILGNLTEQIGGPFT